MNIIITGSGGLVGSEAVEFFCTKGYNVIGIDNNFRKKFFGNNGCNFNNIKFLEKKFKNFKNYKIDISNLKKLETIFKKLKNIYTIIHAAGQPSHDFSNIQPYIDFNSNALGTLNLLNCTKKYYPDASFIFVSTNKVYGDLINHSEIINIREEELRFEGYEDNNKTSVNEKMSIDQSTHSLFGVSKVYADLLCQEYSNLYNLKTGIFRCGCITGRKHNGVELHGFMSYFIKCLKNNHDYTIYGYKGKQVRDNIHSIDLINAFFQFIKKPKSGAVYNLGGGRNNNVSILELIQILKAKKSNIEKNIFYNKKSRIGDHKWYISDNTKFINDYPSWSQKNNILNIVDEIYYNS
jgi:CDP-paratose 2-epimerase